MRRIALAVTGFVVVAVVLLMIGTALATSFSPGLRGRMWFEEYVDSQIAPDVIGLFQQKVLGPLLHKKEPDPAVVRRLLEEDLPPKLDYLERSLDGDYFVGGKIAFGQNVEHFAPDIAGGTHHGDLVTHC